MDGTGTLYNLTFNKSDNDVIHTSSLVIENNLDVTLAAGHSLRPSSGSNTVTVRGNTYLTTGNIEILHNIRELIIGVWLQ